MNARAVGTVFLPLVWCASVLALPVTGKDNHRSRSTGTVTVVVRPGNPSSEFSPKRALGAGIDGHEKGDIECTLTEKNVQAMLSAGFKPLTYRLRTELAIEAWHWNPKGTWSDPAHAQGYWISSSRVDAPISVCYGYRLPRRGSTIDQANNDGYSRLDDGDLASFWKSNPYLDRYFTGEDNASHPQWVLIDLGSLQQVNAIRLLWGATYATRYVVEYGTDYAGPDVAFFVGGPAGVWRGFPNGDVSEGKGGEVLIRLSELPVSTRFVRVWMTASSGGSLPGSTDIRDTLGYAIRELYLGAVDRTGQFHDLIRHASDHSHQTVTYASSTDQWHRAVDIDERAEQPGFDRVFSSGLTNGLPMLTPVPVLYDTPENAVAEVEYLKARGFSVERIEMGEEPEGQYVAPEDYGALYRQWAQALHSSNPRLRLGGPSLAAIDTDWVTSSDAPSTRTWMRRFLTYLRERDRLGDFQFFSFEWYPFDNISAPAAPQLAKAPEMLKRAVSEMKEAGVSGQIPWLIVEYGYSAFAGRAEVSIEGALLNAEIVGQFLTLGGEAAYLYGYEPGELMEGVPGARNAWGNNMLFLKDGVGHITHRMATYHGARLLTQEWVQSVDSPHQVFPAASDIRDHFGRPLVTAYAVLRPDGEWAIMLINKDPKRAWPVRVQLRNAVTGAVSFLRGPVDLFQFSSAQYLWRADQARGFPIRSHPALHTALNGNHGLVVRLPRYSLSVVRGRVR